MRAALPHDAQAWCRPQLILATGKPYHEILRVARERDAHVILLGGHPDPDGIGAALAHKRLCERLGVSATIAHVLPLSRSENRALVKLLNVPMVKVSDPSELQDFGYLALVDASASEPSLKIPEKLKLLTVVEERRFRRLGGTAEVMVDVRVIAATNQDPLRAVRAGALREDLYYRLNVFTIALPPLRERLADLDELTRALLSELNERHQRQIRGLDDGARSVLRGYGWPGNVRELRNVLERAVIVCPDDLIRTEHLPSPPRSAAGAQPPLAAGEGGSANGALSLPIGTTVDEAERQLILRTLGHTGNNKTRAAEILGISLKTLHNKLHRYRA